VDLLNLLIWRNWKRNYFYFSLIMKKHLFLIITLAVVLFAFATPTKSLQNKLEGRCYDFRVQCKKNGVWQQSFVITEKANSLTKAKQKAEASYPNCKVNLKRNSYTCED
jgi:hypothetical protein